MAPDLSIAGIRARSVSRGVVISHKRPEPFIATRISLAWVTAAIRAGASDVAWAVLYHRGLARGDPFKASAQDLALDCISVDTARRQLAALEGTYLVHLDRQPGCKPIITVLDPPSAKEPAP